MNHMMHAAAIDETVPPEVLTLREVPMPGLATDAVMVQGVTAGVQPADAAIRSGWTLPGATLSFPQGLGKEFSTADRWDGLARRVAAGELTEDIRATSPLIEVARAHRAVETGHERGTAVLAIGDAR